VGLGRGSREAKVNSNQLETLKGEYLVIYGFQEEQINHAARLLN